MPYLTTYADEGRGLYKTGTGIVTSAEIFASAMQRSLEPEATVRLRYALVDFSEVTEFRVTPEDIRRVIEINRRVAVHAPHALVALAAPGALPYAMSRLWQVFADDMGWTANVFRTKADAIMWLQKQLIARAGSEQVLDQYPNLARELRNSLDRSNDGGALGSDAAKLRG